MIALHRVGKAIKTPPHVAFTDEWIRTNVMRARRCNILGWYFKGPKYYMDRIYLCGKALIYLTICWKKVFKSVTLIFFHLTSGHCGIFRPMQWMVFEHYHIFNILLQRTQFRMHSWKQIHKWILQSIFYIWFFRNWSQNWYKWKVRSVANLNSRNHLQ